MIKVLNTFTCLFIYNKILLRGQQVHNIMTRLSLSDWKLKSVDVFKFQNLRKADRINENNNFAN